MKGYPQMTQICADAYGEEAGFYHEIVFLKNLRSSAQAADKGYADGFARADQIKRGHPNIQQFLKRAIHR